MFTYQISYILRNLRELQKSGKDGITEPELKKELKKSVVAYTPDE